MHYLDIIFEKGKKRGAPAVVFYDKVISGLGEYIRGGITRNERHDLLKGWKDLDGHILSHKRTLVCKTHEGVQV